MVAKAVIKARAVLLFINLILAVFILAGCATKITIQVQRTPALDTKGIQRIAVMPFGGAYSSAAQHATDVAISNIQATNRFTLVSSNKINEVRRSRESLENYVDALFIGQITNISEDNSDQESSYKTKDGKVVTFITFTRTVSVEFTYYLERARDGSMLGPVTKKGDTSASADNSGALPSAASLANKIIDSQMSSLYRDLVPYTVTVQRAMEKESDKSLKQPMETALAYVKAGNYIAANKAYLDIWESYQSIAAAVNASILYEAIGETRTAANFMQQVYAATGSPLVSDTLARLNRELAEQAGVEQFDNSQTSAEKAANHAVNEVQKVVPAQAKLWIHNNSSSNQSLVNAVVDNMISAFIANRITVIERQMIDLVLKEQNFQLSGNVSDSDFVSIGNLAGANAVVIVNISGLGAERRLQLRVLDIRSGTVIMQSDTGNAWNL